jgi:quercetin dioxygenase-like cupin family protein
MVENLDGVLTGNAADEAADRGWFVGHFVDGADDPRATAAVEVKWAVYRGGESRRRWSANREGTTLAVLVRGRFQLRFPGGDVVLAREGDYALWQPGIPHDWQAEGPTVVLTVRWPSLPGDSVDLTSGEPG